MSPENSKSITIIETICDDGTPPLPPVLLCPGEQFMEIWVSDNILEAEVIAVSQTGYTNEKIALAWLDHFIKHVEAGPDKHWHILVLDGHITHHKADFVGKCYSIHIVPFGLPSHLIHVLQPLDVGVFHPWKHDHNKAIHNAQHLLDMEYRISSFFRDLSSICEQSFQVHTIQTVFQGSATFPVAFKEPLNKMRYYNARRNPKCISTTSALSSSESCPSMRGNSAEEEVSIEEGDELELLVLPSTDFECQ